MEKTVAQKLLAGSRNIDRMQSEIKQLVSMVVGFSKIAAKEQPHGAPRPFYSFQSKNCDWKIDLTFDGNSRSWQSYSGFTVECLDEDGHLVFGKDFHFQRLQKNSLSAAYVELNDLIVYSIAHIFPGIQKHWEYLINASEL